MRNHAAQAGPNGFDFDKAMRAHLERVFNERDVGRRRAALEELYDEDATLFEPGAAAQGRQAISDAVSALLAGLPPDFVFTPAGPAVGHHRVARLYWRAGPPAGAAAVTGTDVARFEEGRIKTLHVFLDPQPR